VECKNFGTPLLEGGMDVGRGLLWGSGSYTKTVVVLLHLKGDKIGNKEL